jgi:3-oxoacyl-[acyl-carrier protein] reductase
MTDRMQRRILVVGATGDIGSAIARRLHAEGARLHLSGRSEDKLQRLVSELGPASTATAADLAIPGAAKALITAAVDALGGLDALVSAFGAAEPDWAIRPKWDVWERAFALNVRGFAELCQAAFGVLKRAENAAIISIVSTAGSEGVAGRGSYSASKGAQRAYADALRAEAVRHGVRVVSISPARVDSRLQPEADRSALIPPEDIAAAAAFALSLSPRTVLSEIRLDNRPVDAAGS